jgi:hypothetical protein
MLEKYEKKSQKKHLKAENLLENGLEENHTIFHRVYITFHL